MELQIETIEELKKVPEWLLNQVGKKKIILFYGAMGVGKTTLIKELCTHLQSNDTVSSPTFSLVNEYHYPSGKIYHFDFYRIEQEEEAYDMGVEDYFYSGDYCFVEWPEKISNLLPLEEECASIFIEENNLKRTYKVS